MECWTQKTTRSTQALNHQDPFLMRHGSQPTANRPLHLVASYDTQGGAEDVFYPDVPTGEYLFKKLFPRQSFLKSIFFSSCKIPENQESTSLMVTNKVMPYTDYTMTPCIQKVLYSSTVPREGFDSSVIMPFPWCVVAVTLPI